MARLFDKETAINWMENIVHDLKSGKRVFVSGVARGVDGNAKDTDGNELPITELKEFTIWTGKDE